MSITKKTLDHPVLTLIVFALLLIVGIFTLQNVAVSLMPDVDSPYVTVRTSYTNASPESVEKSVTKVLSPFEADKSEHMFHSLALKIILCSSAAFVFFSNSLIVVSSFNKVNIY